MSRAERLLELLQCLRRHKYPVAGAALAAELKVSLRTLYRDIASLQAQGALIEGEAGVGYVLRPGFILPPLMLTEEEIEAITLGTQWIAQKADADLRDAADNALAKILAVLPDTIRRKMMTSSLLVGPSERESFDDDKVSAIRQAIRSERKLKIAYRDKQGNDSLRIIWPFALGFFEHVQIIVAWCELRNEFRHFRADKLVNLTVLEQNYPRRRHSLLKEWSLVNRKS